MQRHILRAALFCFVALPASAQSSWELLHPPGGDLALPGMLDVDVMPPDRAIAAGYDGCVALTENGGETWIECYRIPGGPELSAVCYVDSETFLVSTGSQILRSDDAGQTWTAIDMENIWDLQFADPNHGYAVGSNGVFRSDDSGETWTSQLQVPDVRFNSVTVVDQNTAIAAGYCYFCDGYQFLAELWRTDDGGLTWQSIRGDLDVGYLMIDFVDAATGVTTLHRSTGSYTAWIYGTETGFPPWTQYLELSQSFTRRFHGIDMVDANVIAAAGVQFNQAPNPGFLSYSADGGATWGLHQFSDGLYAIGMFSADRGVAFGNSGAIYGTDNGWETWLRRAGGRDNFVMHSVEFHDADHGIALANGSPEALAFLTADGGATWFESPVKTRVRDVAYATSDTIYVVGWSSMRTDDGLGEPRHTRGNAIWRGIIAEGADQPMAVAWDMNFIKGDPLGSANDPTLNVHAIATLSSDLCVVVGDSGLVVVGPVGSVLPWFDVSHPVETDLFGVATPDPNLVIAVGDNGTVIRGDLAISDWTPIASGTAEALHDVAFRNASHGFAVGATGTLLRTSDAGVTWFVESLGTTEDLRRVVFSDADNGLILGEGSAVFRTANGGVSWVAQDAPVPITDATPVGTDKVMVVNSRESIIRWNAGALGSAREVTIDVKPSSVENPINCQQDSGVIPVAILTTDSFDALGIDHETVRFGPGEAAEVHIARRPKARGDGAALGRKSEGAPRRHEEDVDLDGDLDLVFHFALAEAEIECGDTEVTLTGHTYDGEAIAGTDHVRTGPNRDSNRGRNEDLRISPNPFNPATSIEFLAGEHQHVRIDVYDVRGRLVSELANEIYSFGRHVIEWNGQDTAGREVSSGMYLFRIELGGEVQIRKALLIK